MGRPVKDIYGRKGMAKMVGVVSRWVGRITEEWHFHVD